MMMDLAHLIIIFYSKSNKKMMYRVKDFRYADWKDLQLDTDVIMGRLLHNRIGYTTSENLPMLLGLKPEPWLGEMEKLILEKIPKGKSYSTGNPCRFP